MSTITVSPPGLGTIAYFTFKEPFISYIKNKLNVTDDAIFLKVIGINNLRSMIEAELRDPYVDCYKPAGVSTVDYKTDVLDDVPLYVMSHTSRLGKITYIKCPLSYIEDFSLSADINYVNKILVLDLQKMPEAVDTTIIFQELSDLIFDRLGVRPFMKEVSIGEPEKVTREEYDIREAIRINSVTVRKSNLTLYTEVSLKYSQMVSRLAELNISLG